MNDEDNVENNIVSYTWKRHIGRNDLILIIDPSLDHAMNNISRVIRHFKSFNIGEIYTEETEKYKEYIIKNNNNNNTKNNIYTTDHNHNGQVTEIVHSFSQLNKDILSDIASRQGGDFSCEIVLDEFHRNALKKIDDETNRKKYIKHLKPIHFLSQQMVGHTFPEDIRSHLNKFLIIPDAFLILHHPNDAKKFWKKKNLTDLCLKTKNTTNTLLKIFTTSQVKDFPPNLYQRAKLIFAFLSDETEMEDLFRKLGLNNYYVKDTFVQTFQGLNKFSNNGDKIETDQDEEEYKNKNENKMEKIENDLRMLQIKRNKIMTMGSRGLVIERNLKEIINPNTGNLETICIPTIWHTKNY